MRDGDRAKLREAGTVAVGDISNSLASRRGRCGEAGLDGVVFHELLGFNERDGALVDDRRARMRAMRATGDGRVRVSLAPHAPYSASPELFRAIRARSSEIACRSRACTSANRRSEVELLANGTGPWRGMLRDDRRVARRLAVSGLRPGRVSRSLGVLDARTLVVHGVQFDDTALRRLAQIGARW